MSEVKQREEFNEFYRRLLPYYQRGDYARALAMATEALPDYPEETGLVYHIQACLAARMGDVAGALGYLREALAAGHWYADPFWEDEDLAALHDLPEYRRLREQSAACQAAAQRDARPEMLVLPPLDVPEPGTPLPVLMALHGNLHSAVIDAPHWEAARRAGWLLALPQASQVGGPGRYVWDNRARSEREIRAHLAALHAAHTLDPARFVVAGFSMGAETAIRLVLKGVIPARGFIAVAPGGPITREPMSWLPLIESAQGRGLRGSILVGDRDPSFEPVRELAALLNAGGVPCLFEAVAGLRHAFPPDFDARLPGLLDEALGVRGAA